jgi:hypothetical protein
MNFEIEYYNDDADVKRDIKKVRQTYKYLYKLDKYKTGFYESTYADNETYQNVWYRLGKNVSRDIFKNRKEQVKYRNVVKEMELTFKTADVMFDVFSNISRKQKYNRFELALLKRVPPQDILMPKTFNEHEFIAFSALVLPEIKKSGLVEIQGLENMPEFEVINGDVEFNVTTKESLSADLLDL